jgi:hypothetical protein
MAVLIMANICRVRHLKTNAIYLYLYLVMQLSMLMACSEVAASGAACRAAAMRVFSAAGFDC